MNRAAFGLLACTLVIGPGWASGPWQVTAETPAEVVAIDLSTIEPGAAGVGFRERHTLRGGQTGSTSLRRLREILTRRVIDCRGRRIATLSRAVFADNDALVEYQATRPHQAEWRVIASNDPVFRLVCGLKPPPSLQP